MSKTVHISVTVDLPDDASEEELAKELETILASKKHLIDAALDVNIGWPPKLSDPSNPNGGYESRLWSKVTC